MSVRENIMNNDINAKKKTKKSAINAKVKYS